MPRDLIITCFAKPGQGQLNSAGLRAMSPADTFPVQRLNRGTDVIDLEKGMAGHIQPPSGGTYCDQGDVWGGFCFESLADKLKQAGNGSIIRGAILNKGLNPTDYEGGRIALVAFSAGHTMAGKIMNIPGDNQMLDTVLSLDGIAFGKNGSTIIDDPGWMSFATRACGIDRMGATRNPYLGPLMVICHTRIAAPSPLVCATYESSERIFWRLSDPYNAKLNTVPASFVAQQGAAQQQILARAKASLDSVPAPVTINCGTTGTYTRSQLNPSRTGYLGNLWDFEWSGKQGSDHCLVGYIAQKMAFDALIVPRWNSDNVSIAGLGGFGSLGDGPVTFTTPSSAQPGGGLINPGALGGMYLSAATVIAGGLAAYAGYHLGKKIGS
jgi:hypothetical protein